MEESMVFKMLEGDVRMYSYSDLKLCDAPPKRLFCGLCGNIMVNPIQTFRGEIACKSCYDEKKGDSNICPLDRNTIGTVPIYFQDNAIKMEIEHLNCYCLNDACNWQGRLFELKKHVEQCEYTPLYNQCLQHGNSLETHLEARETRMKEKKCIHENCAYKPKNRSDLKRHLADGVISHAYLYTSTIKQLENEFKTSTLKLKETMTSKTAEMESGIQHLKAQMRLLMNFTTEMQSECDDKINSLVRRINELEAKNLIQRTEFTFYQNPGLRT